MRAVWSWIREFCDPGVSPEDAAEKLTSSGLEVGAVEYLGRGLEDVVTTRIDSMRRHPAADKLSLCTVTDNGKVLNIVCGAKNMKEGDIVALARVGAELPCGIKLKRSKIRGEVSEGMLCSEAELGIGEDSGGILILPHDTPVGVPLANVLGLDDVVFDIEITPNRGDCLSVFGIARELSALFSFPLKEVKVSSLPGEDKGSAHGVEIKVEDQNGCPLYCGGVVRDVKIGPSPDWIKRRLSAAGIRPINNVVDVTNYVMLELGNPLHAFDLSLLKGKTIVVRRAKEGEKIMTLDGIERELVADDLLICDASGPVAVAGVMGGEHSGVSEKTTDVLIEGAVFDPASVRKTAKRLGLSTDSSYRFERGVDPSMTVIAVRRAADLLAEIAGGRPAESVISVRAPSLNLEQRPVVNLRPERASSVLGKDVSAVRCVEILSSLGIEVIEREGVLECAVPWHRALDLCREIDLIEEIARIEGLDSVPSSLPPCAAEPSEVDPVADLVSRVWPGLCALGFFEAVNYVFTSFEEAERFTFEPGRGVVEVANPLGSTQAVLRPSLLPSLVSNLSENLARGAERVSLCEWGRVFFSSLKEGELPEEREFFAAVLCGRRGTEIWDGRAEADFFDIKRAVEFVLNSAGVVRVSFEPCRRSGKCRKIFHPGRSALITVGGLKIGEIGAVHPALREELDLPLFFMAELDLGALLSRSSGKVKYRPLPKYPVVTRDVALLIDRDVTFEDVRRQALKLKEPLLSSIYPFDLYTGSHVPEGKVSLGVRMVYRAEDRTLSDDEVDRAHAKLTEHLIKAFNAEIRK